VRAGIRTVSPELLPGSLTNAPVDSDFLLARRAC
jgi:hypothetical protein